MIIQLLIATNIIIGTFALTSSEDIKCYPLGTREDYKGSDLYNPLSNQCICLPHVTGKSCDVCETGFYNILAGNGCEDCHCNAKGTKPGSSCDKNGKCQCNEGYSGYRCDRFFKGACNCEGLLKDELNRIIIIMTMVQDAINNYNPNNDYNFAQHVSTLQDAIKKLYNDIQNEKYEPVDDDLNNITTQTAKIQQEIALLKATLQHINIPKNLLMQLENKIHQLENLIDQCTKTLLNAYELSKNLTNHNTEMTKLSKEAYKIANKIENLTPIMEDISKSYHTTDGKAKELQQTVDEIKMEKVKTLHTFLNYRNRTKKLHADTKKIKKDAMLAKSNLDQIRIPTYQEALQNLSCDIHVPEFENDYETKMQKQFDDTNLLQQQLEGLNIKMNSENNQVNGTLERYHENVEKMKAMYNELLITIDRLVYETNNNIDGILDKSRTNKNDLMIVQNELGHLIHKLKRFLEQTEELEELMKSKGDLLVQLGEKVEEKKNDIKIMEELGYVLDAIPSTPEKLDEVERQIAILEEHIKNYERYVQLEELHNHLESEVDKIGEIVKQLENLPSSGTICKTNITVEGKL